MLDNIRKLNVPKPDRAILKKIRVKGLQHEQFYAIFCFTCRLRQTHSYACKVTQLLSTNKTLRCLIIAGRNNKSDKEELEILGNKQLDVLFHVFIYFMSLHVSSATTLIIRRSNCINTSSGMISLCK